MWRSLLFVPVLADRFVAKAADRGADAVVLDLEASIAADRKDEARAALPGVVAGLAPRIDVTLRINPLWLEAIRDLEAAVLPGVRALHLARCGSADEVRAVAGILSELEQARGLHPIPLIPMLESPAAVLEARAIAEASPRVMALTLGVEDYATEMGTAATETLLRPAGFDVIQAARAAGVAPLVVPASMADFRDTAGLETAAHHGRALGSTGGYAVHPDQVAVLNRVFAPTQAERDWARRVVAAAETAKARGDGVFQVDGQMIDAPLITRAEQILAR